MARLGMGTPLFEPGPRKGRSAPQIGDIGHITRHGRFVPLFNVHSGESYILGADKKYPKVKINGVPWNPGRKGVISETSEELTGLRELRPFTSSSVTGVGAGAS